MFAALIVGTAPAQRDVGKTFEKVNEHASKGDPEGAADVLTAALADQNPLNKAVLLLRRAEVYRWMGRPSAALADLDEAAGLLGDQTDDERRTLCYLHGVRSQTYLDWGLLDVAQQSIETAKELLKGLKAVTPPPDAEQLQTHFVEATILRGMEDYPALEEAVKRALEQEVYETHPREAAKLRARLGYALKELARTRPEESGRARKLLEDALETLPTYERPETELALAELCIRERNWAEAERHLEGADATMVPEDPNATAYRAMRARLLQERDDVVADATALRAARDHLVDTLGDRLEEWRSRELRPGGYSFIQYADRMSLLSELVRLELALDPESGGVERALGHLLAAQDVGTLARRLDCPATDLRAVREQLLGAAGFDAILIYFPATDQSQLFVLHADGIDSFELPAIDFLEIARQEVVKLFQGHLPAGAPAWRVSRRRKAREDLAALLIPAEIHERLAGAQRIAIVGTDLLGEVPFEMLAVGKSAFLGTSVAISYLPSLPIALKLAERARKEVRPRADAERCALLLAAPRASELELGAERFTPLTSAYEDGACTARIGPRATLEALRADIGGCTVVEVFTHGKRDETRERQATFVLDVDPTATGVLVGAEEVERLLAPPLTVLAICDAGYSPKRRGDGGAADLAGAFFTAGARARCVIQSPFGLEAEAALRISADLHEGLAAGLPPDEALREARARLAADERFSDPFLHGWIRVVGAGHVPVFAR